jgi:hypothetical protein
VRGEGGEALLDALLVADVGEDLLEHRHRRALRRRDVHPRLGHQLEEAHRLEGDRLASRVGAGDDQGDEVFLFRGLLLGAPRTPRAPRPEADVDGDDVPGQQGVAGLDEVEPVVLLQPGGGRPDGQGVLGLGQGEVDRRQGVHVVDDAVGELADETGEVLQHPLDLLLFLQLEVAPLVVQLDSGQGLHEDGRPARRFVVDDPPELVARLRPHRDDVPPGPGGDQGLLEHRPGGAAVQDPLEGVHQPVVGRAQLGPDPGQRRGGGVQDLPPLPDAVLDRPGHDGARVERLRPPGQEGEALRVAGQDAPHVEGALQRVAHLLQGGGVQDRPHPGPLGGRAHVVGRPDGEVRLDLEQEPGLGRLRQPGLHRPPARRRLDGQGQLAAGGEGRPLGEALADLRELEDGDGAGVHTPRV